MNRNKIVSLEQAVGRTRQLRARGKIIVTANGSFDLLHAGHVRFLQTAKEQGNVLVVGVNSDASVRRYKSPLRPVNPERQRAEVVAALEAVDLVVIFDEEDPRAFLAAIRPDVHVNGSEYGPDCIEREVVERGGGRIHLVQHSEAVSSTEIMRRIVEIARSERKLT